MYMKMEAPSQRISCAGTPVVSRWGGTGAITFLCGRRRGWPVGWRAAGPVSPSGCAVDVDLRTRAVRRRLHQRRPPRESSCGSQPNGGRSEAPPAVFLRWPAAGADHGVGRPGAGPTELKCLPDTGAERRATLPHLCTALFSR